MIDSYEHEILFSHAIFSSPEFLSYKYSLQERVRLQQNPLEKQIQRVLPELCRQITHNNNTLKDQLISTMLNCTEEIKNQFKVELRGTEQNINVRVSRIQAAITTCLDNVTACLDNARTTFQELPDTDTNMSLDEESNPDTVQRRIEVDSEAQEYVIQPEVTDQVPLFEDIISSAVTTFPQILLEWEVGRQGFPSIASTEAQWKTKWRQSQQQMKAFSRRKVLYNLITDYAATKWISNSEAAKLIEEKRKQHKLSIRHISDKWKQFQQQHLSY
jgi:chorismate mutase